MYTVSLTDRKAAGAKVSCPSGLTTFISKVPEGLDGVTASIWKLLLYSVVAGFLPIETLAPSRNPAPSIIIIVPPDVDPYLGLILLMAVSYTHLRAHET